MTSHERTVLFYVILVSLTAVNIILTAALFSSLLLGKEQPYMQWLLGVFATEFVGASIFGWNRLFKSDPDKNTNDSDEKQPNTKIQILNNNSQRPFDEVLAKDSVPMEKDENDSWAKILAEGKVFLDKSREKHYSRVNQITFARNSVEKFSQIPTESKNHIRGLLNIGTAHREMTEYFTALEYYKKAKDFLLEKKSFFSETEEITWLATIEMMEGTVFLTQNMFWEANEKFLVAWSIKRSYFMPLLNMFEVSFRLKNLTEAELLKKMMMTYKEYSEVVELVEMKLELLRNLGPRPKLNGHKPGKRVRQQHQDHQ